MASKEEHEYHNQKAVEAAHYRHHRHEYMLQEILNRYQGNLQAVMPTASLIVSDDFVGCVE